MLNLTQFQELMAEFQSWTLEHVLVPGNIGQVVAIALAFWVSGFAARRLGDRLDQKTSSRWLQSATFEKLRATLPELIRPVVWLVLIWLLVLVSSASPWSPQVSKAVMSLLTAWIVIRLASTFITDTGWSHFVAVTAWTVAALSILNLLQPTIVVMDNLAVTFGDLRISVLSVGKGVLLLTLLLWLASMGSQILERRIQTLPNLTPSVQVLFTKLLKVTLFSLAIVAALQSIGIDLTALTVFGGAVGLGVGFGLQKVVSNLISGVVLLLDKSVKPGDVIAIGDQYGWINSLGARYVSLITRDGIEHLIPNEEMISQRVENWSYSHQLVRLKIPLGISYESDVRKALQIAEGAVVHVDRVLTDPPPVGRMIGFGDSAIEIELRLWINDPKNGVTNVKSDALLHILDAFRENGVEIPFPRREVYLNAKSPVPVTMVEDPSGASS